MTNLIPTDADREVTRCLAENLCFSMVAGAGSGKTTSLIQALEHIRSEFGKNLRRDGQRVACITYTNRAVQVISGRLNHDDLFVVSTMHSFLWNEIKRFAIDIKAMLREHRIPAQIDKAREKDNGRDTKDARAARETITRLEEELALIEDVSVFTYSDAPFSDYRNGGLSHDDIIEIAGCFFQERPMFRKGLGFRYPYIFVDEAQDTSSIIISGLNLACSEQGLPIVGYFGDPWQQIYDKSVGEFAPPPPPRGVQITKTENFRCSVSVIALLNAFRDDVQQYPAGKNADVPGSVFITLVQAENPQGQRKRYTEEQIGRSLERLDIVLEGYGWRDREDIIKLFLVRRMIARRLGFSALHQLFTGQFASTKAQEGYEKGEHFLLAPIIKIIWPLVEASIASNSRAAIDILRRSSPSFDVYGDNSEVPLIEMIRQSSARISELSQIWERGTLRDVFAYCRGHKLFTFSDRLKTHLDRAPRNEVYDEEIFSDCKSDWLCDNFFNMGTSELQAYCKFISENSIYSTQHGVKGEEYPNVLMVIDDIEAAWTDYSFTKLLAPQTFGAPTEGQLSKTEKIAYVCFSRAEENLRIVFFTLNPESMKREIVQRGFFSEEQVEILGN
ncbi:MAG: UvrD-helicase domain-containing protein [Gammaproteobacteria bacterium]|nr:UvrD-helicase domain-containing protein [Gammaproteobacteria bacterium]